ncbi:hypothetical protein H2200_004954 [Cladophialophora chaetospira]|uniref:BTB domain-containing protein n=1 Tax=Cladophialophora chaetospira TaxID=386627 RepID=A0AA38XE99_9EURO|nr:hypothetical protein H2200_004954 [Cladophialophora chaetospira]
MAAQTTTGGLSPSATDVTSNTPPDPTFNAEKFSSPIITLRIGPERTIVTAHKAILTEADYFAKCLAEGRFDEGAKNEIECPEDVARDMLAVARYLYTGGLHQPGHQFAHPSSYDMPQLIQLYAIADKYCIDGMCQQVLNIIRTHYPALRMTWRHLDQLKEAGLHGSRIWKLFIERIAQNLDEYRTHVNVTEMLQDGLGSDAETAMELLRQVAANQSTQDELERSRNLDSWNNNWTSGGNNISNSGAN